MESHVTHRQRLWLYIFVGLVVFYLVVPTLVVVPISFSATSALTFPPPGWSLRWYQAFFGQAKWIGSLWISLQVAFGTMVLTTVFGVAAYALHRSGFRWANAVRSTLVSPLAVPTILIAISIFFVYAMIGGLLNTLPGMVLGHVVVAMPFVILTMDAGLAAQALYHLPRGQGHAGAAGGADEVDRDPRLQPDDDLSRQRARA